ncbi:MAG: hypothetical protein ABR616_18835 [Dermatophilaceae bacterium]|nr:hypothetical protein [Intrasporangiaceae bacterium]
MIRGEDYHADTPKSFRSTVYSAARRYGVKVETALIEGNLNVQRISITDEDAWKKMTERPYLNGVRRKTVVRKTD